MVGTEVLGVVGMRDGDGRAMGGGEGWWEHWGQG